MPQRPIRSDRRRALVALGALACAPGVRAQSFPSKPIKVLIGVPAGGTQDVLTRAIADSVRGSLGPLIIDNRSGAAGRLAADAVKAAEPDGHTLLLGTAGMMTMFPNAYKKLSYDPMKDFLPIVNAASFELAMVVNSSCRPRNLAEFIAWAKTQGPNGEKVSFASYGAGTPSHFLGEMLNRAVGLQMVHVPVPRLDAGAPGRDGRHGAALFRHGRRRDHDAADRPGQGARDQRREALAADAVGADLRRARPQGRDRERLVLVLRAGEDPGTGRRASCAPSF